MINHRSIYLVLSGLLSATAIFSQESNSNKTPDSARKFEVTVETSKGSIQIELDADNAPISTGNFLRYSKKGYYKGTIFHRVIPDFMIQGGGFEAEMSQKQTDAPIANESKNGLKNARGTIAMARTNVPDSATSQFFINVKDNANLDYPSFDGYGYAVFGKVTAGLDIVDAIVGVPTTTKGPHQNVPVEPIIIKAVTFPSTSICGDGVKLGQLQIHPTWRKSSDLGVGEFKKDENSETAYIVVQLAYKNISKLPTSQNVRISLIDQNKAELQSDVGASLAVNAELNTNEKVISELNPGVTVNSATVFEVGVEAFNLAESVLKLSVDGKDTEIPLNKIPPP